MNLIQDKLKLRLKIIEEGLKDSSSFLVNPKRFCKSPKTEKSSNIFGFLTSNGGLRKRSTSQPRASTVSISSPLQNPIVEKETGNVTLELKQANNLKKKYASGENMLKKSIWASRSKVVDSNEKENTDNDETTASPERKSKSGPQNKGSNEDVVSGLLYDRLQKEVINLRKLCDVKESTLNTKDEEIKVMYKKLCSLSLSHTLREY